MCRAQKALPLLPTVKIVFYIFNSIYFTRKELHKVLDETFIGIYILHTYTCKISAFYNFHVSSLPMCCNQSGIGMEMEICLPTDNHIHTYNV